MQKFLKEEEVQEEKRTCWFTGFLNQISSLNQGKLAVFLRRRRRQINLVHQMQEAYKLQVHLNYFSVIFSKQLLKVCCVLLMCCLQCQSQNAAAQADVTVQDDTQVCQRL